MSEAEKEQPANTEKAEPKAEVPEKKEEKAQSAESQEKKPEQKEKAQEKKEEKTEASAPAEEKRKKVTQMSLREVEQELKTVKEKMGGFCSRYAQDLLQRKKVLAGN